MEDENIIELFWKRSEDAIVQTKTKYGNYCKNIAINILENKEEAEECENDSYLNLWNTIPPEKPLSLKAFLGRICRNLSLDYYRKKNAQKRGSGQVDLILEELEECIAVSKGPDEILEANQLKEILNNFLAKLPSNKRRIFMRRYWYMDNIQNIAKKENISEGNVKVILYRTRNDLKKLLQKEDFLYEK